MPKFTGKTSKSIAPSLPPEVEKVNPEDTHLEAALINLAYYVFENENFDNALQMLKIKFGDRFYVVLRSDYITSCHKSRLKAVAIKEIQDDESEILHIAIGGTTEQQDYLDSISAMTASHFGYTHSLQKTTSIREFINHKKLDSFKDNLKKIHGHSLGGLIAMHMGCEFSAKNDNNWLCKTLSSLRSQHVIGTEIEEHNKNPQSNKYFLGPNKISITPKNVCTNYTSPGDFGFATGPDWGKTVHLKKPLPQFKTKGFCKSLSWLVKGFNGNDAQHELKFFLQTGFYKQEEVLKEHPKLFKFPELFKFTKLFIRSKELSKLFKYHDEYFEHLLSFMTPFHKVCEELLQTRQIIGDSDPEVVMT